MKNKDCSVLHVKAQENGIPRANHKGKRPTRICRNQNKKLISINQNCHQWQSQISGAKASNNFKNMIDS